MYRKEVISLIKDCSFYIDYIAVISKTVIPPSAFSCKRNMVLYDRFFYVSEGEIIFETNNKKILRYGPGSIVYLPYNITYNSHWDTSRPGKFISINFVLKDRDNTILSLGNQIEQIAKDVNQRYLLDFKQLDKTWNGGTFGYRLRSHSQFYNILYQLLLETEQLFINNNYKNIASAIIYLENHYMSDVTTKELIKLTNIKECMFRRTFKSLKGMSPIKYRNTLRLMKAYEMLQSGEYSVFEVGLAVGFNDAGYFNRLFKEQFKVNPSSCIKT